MRKFFASFVVFSFFLVLGHGKAFGKNKVIQEWPSPDKKKVAFLECVDYVEAKYTASKCLLKIKDKKTKAEDVVYVSDLGSLIYVEWAKKSNFLFYSFFSSFGEIDEGCGPRSIMGYNLNQKDKDKRKIIIEKDDRNLVEVSWTDVLELGKYNDYMYQISVNFKLTGNTITYYRLLRSVSDTLHEVSIITKDFKGKIISQKTKKIAGEAGCDC